MGIGTKRSTHLRLNRQGKKKPEEVQNAPEKGEPNSREAFRALLDISREYANTDGEAHGEPSWVRESEADSNGKRDPKSSECTEFWKRPAGAYASKEPRQKNTPMLTVR